MLFIVELSVAFSVEKTWHSIQHSIQQIWTLYLLLLMYSWIALIWANKFFLNVNILSHISHLCRILLEFGDMEDPLAFEYSFFEERESSLVLETIHQIESNSRSCIFIRNVYLLDRSIITIWAFLAYVGWGHRHYRRLKLISRYLFIHLKLRWVYSHFPSVES